MTTSGNAAKHALDQVEGIVLRVYPCGEADVVIRVLSPAHGKVALVAKHARRNKPRFSANFDLFDSGIFFVRDGSSEAALPIISDFSPNRTLRKIREDISKIVCASVLCECFDLMTPEREEHDAQLFEIIMAGLHAIDAAPATKEALKGCFLTLCRLLLHSGFASKEQLPAPSAHGLLSLLRQVEGCAEKALSSKPALIEILKQLPKPEES